jgi:hypothetical protein
MLIQLADSQRSGPAIKFSDGWKVYAVNGVRIPHWVISDPSRITVARINSERNVELRRILIQRYGWSKYLYKSGAELIDDDVDQYGRPLRLYRLPIAGDEDLVMVEVTNSTPHWDRRELMSSTATRCGYHQP